MKKTASTLKSERGTIQVKLTGVAAGRGIALTELIPITSRRWHHPVEFTI